LVSDHSLILAVMCGDQDSVLWEAFVLAMLAASPAVKRRSRYGEKPALFTASREIAHLEQCHGLERFDVVGVQRCGRGREAVLVTECDVVPGAVVARAWR
jgi:hypothetical protein